jgi:hypothetical protein
MSIMLNTDERRTEMNFDFTHGEEARYMVGIYSETAYDRCFFHLYRKAKEFFDKHEAKTGESVSIYDLKKDVRKAFKKA